LLEYRVDTPAAWSEIQKGLVALKAAPQGFLRLGSTATGAPPGGLAISETRFVA
jgi:hypothetical protein